MECCLQLSNNFLCGILLTDFFHKRAAEIVEYVRKYMDGISQNLQSWVLINQILLRCFCSYGLWLSKSNYRVQQVDISESTDIDQSTSMIQFYPFEALIFIRGFFFHIIHHNSIFSIHGKRVCCSNKWKAWHLCRSILNLLMVIQELKRNFDLTT